MIELTSSVCILTPPTAITSNSSFEDGLVYIYNEPPVTLSFDGENANCAFTRSITKMDGTPITSPPFSYDSGNDKLKFSATNPNYEDFITLRYKIISTSDSSLFDDSFIFTVKFKVSPCSKIFILPSKPYPFAENTYFLDSGPL